MLGPHRQEAVSQDRPEALGSSCSPSLGGTGRYLCCTSLPSTSSGEGRRLRFHTAAPQNHKLQTGASHTLT